MCSHYNLTLLFSSYRRSSSCLCNASRVEVASTTCVRLSAHYGRFNVRCEVRIAASQFYSSANLAPALLWSYRLTRSAWCLRKQYSDDFECMCENWREKTQILCSVQNTLGGNCTQPNGVSFTQMATGYCCLVEEHLRNACAHRVGMILSTCADIDEGKKDLIFSEIFALLAHRALLDFSYIYRRRELAFGPFWYIYFSRSKEI